MTRQYTFEELVDMNETPNNSINEDDIEFGRESFTVPGAHLTMASFDEYDIKIGDVFRCTYHSNPEFINDELEIKRRIDKEALVHYMTHGARYVRIKRAEKKPKKPRE